MNEISFWTVERIAGSLLFLGAIVVFPGLIMFWLRDGHLGGLPPSPAYYAVERTFILSAVIPTVIGFILLSGHFQDQQASILAKIGATGFMFGGVLVVAGEALGLTLGYEKVVELFKVYVIVACLSQIAIGTAFLLSGFPAPWVGWTTILVNASGLAVLLIFSRDDLYFPILHHIAPLLIGISLLFSRH
jgi:hypothetical protein